MSYNLEGKLANQLPSKLRLNGSVTCEKCGKVFNRPDPMIISAGNSVYDVQSYLGTERFIYETKSGHSVVYCSDYCKRKHNHRFQK